MEELEMLDMEVSLVMPSAGDMTLVDQAGGVVKLKPIFYGNECMGPHLVISSKGEVIGRYKIRIRDDGKLELKKGQ